MVNDKFDVAVAGSGIGGLCSAALLARHGYKVLLVESLGRLGGRFSTIEEEGFKLPTGAGLIATRGIIEQTFQEVGATFNVREIGATSAWVDGKWHLLPDKGQIRALLTIIKEADANKAEIAGHLNRGIDQEKILSAFKRGVIETTDPANKTSFREWLSQYTDNEMVKKTFHALTSAMSTVNDFEYPVSHWFVYCSPAGQHGMVFQGVSVNGNIEQANALAESVRTRGGEVWANSPVEQVLIKSGKVIGLVVNKEGKQIELSTRVLVSDLGPRKTVELAGRKNFSADYLKQVDALKPAPIVHTLIASDRPLVDAPGALLAIGASRIVLGVPMTNFCPELAPRGQHMIVTWGTPLPCLHHVNREEEAKANLEDIRRMFPDFDKYGRILRMDIRDIDDEFPALRSWMGYDMSQQTDIPNLVHVGDAVKPFGWEGLAACTKGAHLAVDIVKKKFKPGES